MAKETIDLRVIKDGGNPRNETDIHKIDKNAFSVTPFSEDNDPNYKFRFEVAATNKSDRDQQIRLKINWNEPVYNKYRTTIYHRSEDNEDWSSSPLREDNGGYVSGTLILRNGKSIIASQPSYSYTDYIKFVEKTVSCKRMFHECIGHSAQNRKIHQIIIERNNSKKIKRSIVIACRIHPYETAGSYCTEGVVEALMNDNITMLGKLDRFRLHIIPMVNPDGVFNGLCKRTSHDGIDLSKQIDPNDPTCAAVLAFLDDLRPDIYCEIHNWMLPDVDGIYYLNRFKATRFIRRLPSGLFKPWKIDYRKMFFAGPPEGLKKYCLQKFNSTAFVVEFPWFGRSPADMKTIGAATLNAMTCL